MTTSRLWAIAVVLTANFSSVPSAGARQIPKSYDFQVPNCQVVFRLPPDLAIEEQSPNWFTISDGMAQVSLLIEDWTQSIKKKEDWNFKRTAAERCLVNFMTDSPGSSTSGSVKDQSPFSFGGINGLKYRVDIFRADENAGVPSQSYCYVIDASNKKNARILILTPGLSANALSEGVAERIVYTLKTAQQSAAPDAPRQ